MQYFDGLAITLVLCCCSAIPTLALQHWGALNGANPFHICVDACNFAVVGVLMQRLPAFAAEQVGMSDLYHLLQCPPKATKAELEASVRALRKKYVVSPLPLRDAQLFEKSV